MNIRQYIIKEMDKLESEGYKNPQYVDAVDVKLMRNGTSENFLSAATYLGLECEEYIFHVIPDDLELDGSKITFSAIPKGKRKAVNIVKYVKFV